MYGYVLARVLRWHKDHYRSSETPDTAPYTPSMQVKTRLSTGAGVHTLGPRCFATGSDHLYAARLDQLGIWLGEYDDERRSVNGLSQREVENNFFETTLGGKDIGNAEPHVLRSLPNKASFCEETVVCGHCGGKPNSPSLQLQTMRFEWTNRDDPDVDTASEMRLHVSQRCLLQIPAPALTSTIGLDLSLHIQRKRCLCLCQRVTRT